MKFMKHRWLFFLISALVLVPGIFSLITFGLKPSIDFTGGTLLELRILKEVEDNTWIEMGGEELSIQSVQSSEDNGYILRGKPITDEYKTYF